MRILFLCGSLDPGRDGVGDYVRRLGASCAQRGVEVKLIALNDPAEQVEPESDSVLRLPASLPWREKRAVLRDTASAFGPDRISLHYVPYAFHPRGFCFTLAQLLAGVPSAAKRHVMFHETWITARGGDSWKRGLTSLLQRIGVLALLASLRPAVVHTSTPEYQRLLREVGAHAELLPMFGAIPNTGQRADEWLLPKLREAGAPISPENRRDFLLIGFFGALYPEWSPEPLLSALDAISRRACIISLGALRDGTPVWERMARDHARRHTFLRLGQLPAARISAILNSLDLGVTGVPLAIIGKSSTTAAMLEHSLPVIVTRFEAPLPAEELAALNRRGIYPLGPDGASILQALQRPAPASFLAEATTRFLGSLSGVPMPSPALAGVVGVSQLPGPP